MESIKYSQITDFLENKEIVVIGVSRNPREYSRNLCTDLKKLSYKTIPVNPNINQIDGQTCYASVLDIPGTLTAAIILTPSAVLVNIVHDCISRGIKHLWIYNGNEKDEHLRTSIEVCKEHNVNLVYGFCPLMFLPGTAFPHRLHGGIAKLFGKYPVKS